MILQIIKKYNYLATMFLMLAISSIYALIYKLLAVLDANSFYGLSAKDHPIDFWFYSVTTMTTVGYGDVYPITNLARFVTAAQIVTGVTVFIVIVISSTLLTKGNRFSKKKD